MKVHDYSPLLHAKCLDKNSLGSLNSSHALYFSSQLLLDTRSTILTRSSACMGSKCPLWKPREGNICNWRVKFSTKPQLSAVGNCLAEQKELEHSRNAWTPNEPGTGTPWLHQRRLKWAHFKTKNSKMLVSWQFNFKLSNHRAKIIDMFKGSPHF